MDATIPRACVSTPRAMYIFGSLEMPESTEPNGRGVASFVYASAAHVGPAAPNAYCVASSATTIAPASS